MSVFDNLGKTAKQSTRYLIGVKTITSNGVETYSQGELVFLKVAPTNISVLSHSNIQSKVRELTVFLSTQRNIDFCCLNSAERFDENKIYINSRIDAETNPKIREILQKDLEFLDTIQLNMATSRAFIIAARFRSERRERVDIAVSRLEKALRECHFEAYRMTESEVKRLLAIYFAGDVLHEDFDDYNGAAYAEIAAAYAVSPQEGDEEANGNLQEEEETAAD